MRTNEEKMDNVYTYLNKLDEQDKNLRIYIDDEIQRFRDEFQQSLAAQAQTNKTIKKDAKELSKIVEAQGIKQGHQETNIKSMNQVNEMQKDQIRHLKRDVEGLREDTIELVKDTENKIKDMLNDADKYYIEQFEKIETKLKYTEGIARDSVKTKEKELAEVIVKSTNSLQAYVDDNINDMVKERKDMVAKNEKQFKDIKMVCCKYFEKYDK